MAFNMKTETPDTSLPSTGFLLGADSQGAAAPSIYPVANVLPHVDVRQYGAKGDTLEVHDGVTVASDNTVTSATAWFTSADVGKLIYIAGAGAAGALLATTISAYNGPTSVEVTVAPSSNGSSRKILWGTDDSTAIANAITATAGVQVGTANSFNPGRYGQTLYFPAGRYLHGGITYAARTRLLGEGSHKSVLVLKPGTAAPSVTVGTTGGNSADFQEMWHMGIDGTKRFLAAASYTRSSAPGIYIYSDADTKDEVDRFHRFCHLKIWHTDGAGIKTNSSASDGKLIRGESLFLDINVQHTTSFGLDIVMSDSRFEQVHAGGCDMPGFKLYTQSCQFIGCKSYYNALKGVYDESLTHEAEGSNWIVGGFCNQFFSCQGEESYSSNWYVCGSRNLFVSCVADDTGDLPDNEGTAAYTGDIAGWLIVGAIPTGYTYGQAPTAWADYDASDNNFVNCFVGIAENNGAYHLKNAVKVKTGAKFNRGSFYTQISNAGGAVANPTYSVSKFGWNAPGGSNKILIDDIEVTTGLDASDNEAFWSNYQTSSYTLGAYDASKTIFMGVATANTLTVPPNSSVALPIGSRVTVCQTGAGATTIAAGAGVTINSKDNLTFSGRYGRIVLEKVGTNTWIATGDVGGVNFPADKWLANNIGRLAFADVGEGLRVNEQGLLNIDRRKKISYSQACRSSVTQATSRTTGVTATDPDTNKSGSVHGQITLYTAAPTAGAGTTFTVTNNHVRAQDVILVSIQSKNANNVYLPIVSTVSNNSFQITLWCLSGSTSDAPVLNWVAIGSGDY